ncbi:helix-turn-helix domain-containing protein [Priestia endophytica]|uniref:helix-turn-helix domain-containing protein n=1 Tax=Priestia endophytica TaxID=135735 RepID=UPI003D2C5BBF
MNVGEQLKNLREQHNMSREELAQQMNVSRQAVYKWETNKGYPDMDNLIRLSELYEVTLDELIKSPSTLQPKVDSKDSLTKKDINEFNLEGDGNSFFRYGLMCSVGSLGGLSIPVLKGEVNLSIILPFVISLIAGFLLLKSKAIQWDEIKLKNVKWLSRIVMAYLSVPFSFFSISIIQKDSVYYLFFIVFIAFALYSYLRRLYIKHIY